jgi:uncharacterized protein
MAMNRRTLLRIGGIAALGAVLPLPWILQRRHKPPAGLRPDPRRVIDLPEGFSYRVLDSTGEAMSDGFRVPGRPDGMGCFSGPERSLILMRNHELDRGDTRGAYAGRAPAEAYNSEAPGCVTRLVIDAETLERKSSNVVLAGTLRNCAGGLSPWGWLTCEESVAQGHGYVFLCRTLADKLEKPNRIPAYGRFNHEAACIDPKTLAAYLTEDRMDSGFYRFLPKDPARPFEGRLQALRVIGRERFDSSRMKRGEKLDADWVDIPEPDPAKDTVRLQARERGAALFRRGEGAWFFESAAYFVCTSGGAAYAGQIFRVIPEQPGRPAQLELVAEAASRDQMDGPDNITFAPWGDALLAEDGNGDQLIRGITRDGRYYDVARNAKSSGEFAGVCMSPEGRALFVNLQIDGLTLAITGPFKDLTAAARSVA